MQKITDALQTWTENHPIKIFSLAQVDSTNTYARNLPTDFTNAAVVVADHQTHGRGRGSNTWEDAHSGQLLSSWVFNLNHPPQPIAAPRVGFALYKAAEKTWPTGEWSLKAPNDLLLSGKKVGGLLLEAISQGDVQRLIIGLGLNITTTPKNLPHATCVQDQVANAAQRLMVFFEHWWLELGDAVSELNHPVLSINVCVGLCAALNKNPNLHEAFIRVYPDGGLQTEKSKIDWSSL